MKTQVDSYRMPYKSRNHWPNALASLRHIGASMVIVTAVGSAAAAPPAEPVGLVTELSGVGSVAQKPDGGPLETLRELMPGAVVSLAGAARATVVHTPTGTVYELSGPGRFQVQARSIEPLNGAKLSKRGLPPELRTFQLKPLSTMQASIVMRGAAPLRLEGPNGGVLATDELTYRVRGNLTVQTMEVTDPESSDAWPVSNTGASFVVGTSVPARPGRQYAVVVKGTDARGQSTQLSSRFWLIDADAAARLQAARPAASAPLTDLIVYAMSLETAGATATARAAWTAINERR
jgi:hypothetical protein